MTERNLLEITDHVVKDISRRVAHLEIQSVAAASIDIADSSSLVMNTDGNYPLTMVLYADSRVLRGITLHMKHGETFDDDEVLVYTTEFFNILCGHVITEVNNRSHTVTRFGIPQIVKGVYNLLPPARKMESLFYNSNYGPVIVQTFCRGGCLI